MGKVIVQSICQYANGYRGEHTKGYVEVLEQPAENYNPIYVYVENYVDRYNEGGHRIAEIRLNLTEATELWLQLSQAIRGIEKSK